MINSPTPSPLAELEWRAFQYVSGDMSSDDQSAFEAELEGNQSAREAVAAAVALMAGIKAAYRGGTANVPTFPAQTPAVSQPSVEVLGGRAGAHSHRLHSLVTVVAACALMAWLGRQQSGPPRDSGGRESAAHAPLSQSADLIQRWATPLADAEFELAELESWSAASPFDEAAGMAAATDEEAAGVVREDDLEKDDVIVPGWLLAAVAAERRPGSEDSLELAPEN